MNPLETLFLLFFAVTCDIVVNFQIAKAGRRSTAAAGGTLLRAERPPASMDGMCPTCCVRGLAAEGSLAAADGFNLMKAASEKKKQKKTAAVLVSAARLRDPRVRPIHV